MNNRRIIEWELLAAPPDSDIIIDGNMFFQNQQDGIGQHMVHDNPLFRAPEILDFHLKTGSPAIIEGKYLGPYDSEEGCPTGTNWWNISSKY
jgi:hypothetical protein